MVILETLVDGVEQRLSSRVHDLISKYENNFSVKVNQRYNPVSVVKSESDKRLKNIVDGVEQRLSSRIRNLIVENEKKLNEIVNYEPVSEIEKEIVPEIEKVRVPVLEIEKEIVPEIKEEPIIEINEPVPEIKEKPIAKVRTSYDFVCDKKNALAVKLDRSCNFVPETKEEPIAKVSKSYESIWDKKDRLVAQLKRVYDSVCEKRDSLVESMNRAYESLSLKKVRVARVAAVAGLSFMTLFPCHDNAEANRYNKPAAVKIASTESKIKQADYNESDAILLAKTLFGEARGESTNFKKDVAYSILNRVKNKSWGSTIPTVVLQKKQYSCFNPGDPNRRKALAPWKYNKTVWKECKTVAKEVLTNPDNDTTNGANHFYTDSVPKPYWAKKELPIKTVKNKNGYRTRFYRL